MLSFRGTGRGRAAVAVAMVLASICVTSFEALLLFAWALGSGLE